MCSHSLESQDFLAELNVFSIQKAYTLYTLKFYGTCKRNSNEKHMRGGGREASRRGDDCLVRKGG